MMQLVPQMRILVCVEPVDFRAGIDGLCQLCRQVLESDPVEGTVFAFRNRRATSVKLLAYDGQGFWLVQKRISVGKFRYWPEGRGSIKRELYAHEMSVLLYGGNPEAMQAAPQWRPVVPLSSMETKT
jgi:transposase